ncbi:DUF6083 domain-containing protein [Streptomyces sp. NPDC050743]|uniref:DUF6083 domain-containing protein n=1 Tax=Streptomyces sp. NPDC050743 TaxID=3365634 RepID=UPI0037A68486
MRCTYTPTPPKSSDHGRPCAKASRPSSSTSDRAAARRSQVATRSRSRHMPRSRVHQPGARHWRHQDCHDHARRWRGRPPPGRRSGDRTCGHRHHDTPSIATAGSPAEAAGAAEPPQGPEPDPDDASWIEPPSCPECGAFIRVYPTNYDRWVSLAAVELPAKDVPERFRWRLTRLPGPIPHQRRYRGRTGPWSRSTAQRRRGAGSPA